VQDLGAGSGKANAGLLEMQAWGSVTHNNPLHLTPTTLRSVGAGELNR